MSRPLSTSVCGKYDMPPRRPYERIAEGLISACRKHVVVATRLSPFKVGDNQRPERTMTGVRKPPPESSVPGDNLPGEVGGINCGGDMGVRRCLARSLTSLALMRTPKSANGPRSNSFRPDSPSRPPSTGDGRLSHPPHHTGHGPFRTRPPTSVKSPSYCIFSIKVVG